MSAKSAITQFDSLNEALRNLGLSDGELRLYRISLEAGPQPLSRLAAKLQISRPNIYKLVNGLAARGLAEPSAANSSRRFVVASPSRVAELLDDKQTRQQVIQNDLLRVLPDLLGKYKRGDLPSNVRIYQGQNQYLGAFFAMLNESREYCDFFGSVDDFLQLITADEQSRWLHERMRRGISARTLTLPGPTAERLATEDSKTMRQTRVLQQLIPFSSSFHLFADKIIFWQPESMLAIRVEDDLIAAMLRSIFEFLWQQASTLRA